MKAKRHIHDLDRSLVRPDLIETLIEVARRLVRRLLF